MSDLPSFTIVDFETTGLFPGRRDRIIEVALISINDEGNVIDSYTSLVNPERDVGATHLHGISAGDIMNAPLFGEIAGDIISRLRNCFFVAHNASFDRMFLYAETERLGISLPELPTLCTLKLTSLADPGITGRKLETICQCFDIPIVNTHSAYHDAKATAALFEKCVERLGGWRGFQALDLCIKPLGVPNAEWPATEPSGCSYCRSEAEIFALERNSFLPRLVDRLPTSVGFSVDFEEYVVLLDKVLEDRRIAPEELDMLWATASDLGLTQDQAREAHFHYVSQLMFIALQDNIITQAEKRDLDQVCQLLGLSESEARRAMKHAKELKLTGEAPDIGRQEIIGKSVCFTGSLSCTVHGRKATKQLAREQAERCGMTVQKGVTKKLNLLVAADPDSLSGKAKKAREYGIRIIAEPVFWQITGVDVD